MEPFAFEILLDDGYDQAVDKVTAALKDEGFGVINPDRREGHYQREAG
jgi:uncharacterized protein (DUF302 family)